MRRKCYRLPKVFTKSVTHGNGCIWAAQGHGKAAGGTAAPCWPVRFAQRNFHSRLFGGFGTDSRKSRLQTWSFSVESKTLRQIEVGARALCHAWSGADGVRNGGCGDKSVMFDLGPGISNVRGKGGKWGGIGVERGNGKRETITKRQLRRAGGRPQHTGEEQVGTQHGISVDGRHAVPRGLFGERGMCSCRDRRAPDACE